MARKKIMLFIVEGPTDETALSTVLSRIFSSDTVRFQVVHGDVLTQDFVGPDKMVAAVNEQIKRFRGNIYRLSISLILTVRLSRKAQLSGRLWRGSSTPFIPILRF